MKPEKPKSAWLSQLITQSIALVVCLGVPAIVTWMAPRTTIHLQKVDELSIAEVTRYIFLVLPLPTVEIKPLQQAESIVTPEKKRTHLTSEDKRRGRKLGTTMADGSIKLIGKDRTYQVQSTPQAAPIQAKIINAFIADPEAAPLAMTATAPWPLTYLLGGIMTGLAAFYSLCLLLATIRWLWRNLQPFPRNG